jgi:molybdopterin molybdotransferase
MDETLYSPLLSVEKALEKLLENVSPLSIESVSLSNALTRVLAEDVYAPLDMPPFNNSAMDGFAVRSEDVAGVSKGNPVRLKVVGDISAGEGDVRRIHSGQAARIMTGAVIPEGADAVVPVEFTDDPTELSGKELPDVVVIKKGVQSGEYVRKAGQDVQKGRLVLSCGSRLRPQDIGMLAALGVSTPRVYRKPKVAVISTGDELVELDEELQPGTIRDSNGYAITAAVKSSGAIPLALGIVNDDPQKLAERLDLAVDRGADLLISSAGVSMGAFDFVRSVIESKGKLEFWRVNIRPGKPILKGIYEGVPMIGLPGNPVSALVTFEIFVKPYIYRLCGAKSSQRLKLMATLIHPVKTDGRESYLRANLVQAANGYEVGLVGSQDSGVLSSLVKANALVRIPAGIESLSKGEIVEVWALQIDSIL